MRKTYYRYSLNYARTKDEKEQLKSDFKLYRESRIFDLTSGCDCDTITRTILDSSLITQTKKYSLKIIECGNYYQVYNYNYNKVKRCKDLKIRNSRLVTYSLVNENKNVNLSIVLKKIEIKNINRSRNSIQRLIKANENKFNTFVTLTFSENISDISLANKRFNSWRTYIKKLKKDFLYIAVPEFQSRGAVHYHLLTNIDYDDFNLLSKEIVITKSSKTGSYDYGRSLLSWKFGYSKVKNMDNINVVGYLTKYLTKDLDDRLFGFRRYYYSLNLNRPTESFIDLNDIVDFNKYIGLLDLPKSFESIYFDKLGQVINFVEYKKIGV